MTGKSTGVGSSVQQGTGDELGEMGASLTPPSMSQKVQGVGASLTPPSGSDGAISLELLSVLRVSGTNDVLRSKSLLQEVPTEPTSRTTTMQRTTIPGLNITAPPPPTPLMTPPSSTTTHQTPWFSRLLHNPNPGQSRVPLFPDTNEPPVIADACVSSQAGQTADAVHHLGGGDDISSGDEFLTWWPLPDGHSPQSTTPTIVYHTRAHLPDDQQEAILADTGAYDGIAGEYWAMRQDALARAAGLTPVYSPLPKTLRVQGVGKEAQEVNTKVNMPGRLETGEDIDYEAPIIPKSHVPALAGMKTFERLDGTLDCRVTERKLYLGNDYKIVPGPNTKVIQMYPAISGHLMIPISRFDLRPRRGRTQMNFISEEEPAHPTATSSNDPAPPIQYQ